MESCSQMYTRKIVDSIIHGLEQRHSSILFVKHYNTLNVPVENIQTAVALSTSKIELLYHEFGASRMQEAYEPFLGWIKQLYFKFYFDVPVDEFLAKADVYYQSRSAIASYIMTGECTRSEDIIVVETEYEKKQFAVSLVKIFSYISVDHTLLLVLNRLHLAEDSTLDFLVEFIGSHYDNISFLANYNEAYTVPSYTADTWKTLVRNIEELNYMLDWNMQDVQTTANINESFEPSASEFPNYLVLINNMIQTLAIKQAMHYLKIVYSKIPIEKAVISAKNKARFFVLYATASLYDMNMTTALMMCDKLKNINNKHPNMVYAFRYYYLLTLCQVYGGQPNLAKKNLEKCMKIARKSQSDRYAFSAQMLKYICKLDGWNNSYRWDRTIEGKELDDFIEKAFEYKMYNHLAHILFFGCCNSKENFIDDSQNCEEQESFKKAMAIAKMIKNDRLIIAAWMKNVFLAQGYGCFSYVDYYYKKCLEIIEGQNNIFEEASIYNGLGFNRIVSEQFGRANNYFNDALELFYKQKDTYYVSETLYNMAINAILADKYETAYNYLIYCIKLLKSIKQQRMRVCNMSKLYGMIVYCSYKMGIEYNAHFYLNKMYYVIYHVLHSDAENRFFLWDDDMFFYYFCSGLLEKADNPKKAQGYFDKAKYHMLRTEGLWFFVYTMFAMEQADLYEQCGKPDEAEKILEECMEFCNKNHYKHKEELLFAKLHKHPMIPPKNSDLILEKVSKYQIEELVQHSEMKMALADKTKGIDFLVAWQELLNKENSSYSDIIENCMTAMQNNYNIDSILYIEVTADKKPVIRYNSGEIEIEEEMLNDITAYFSKHKKEVVSSRFDREFYEYTAILSLYGVNNIVSFVCVPLSQGDELTGLMIATIELHENMTGGIIFLDRNDLTIFKSALNQMTNTLYRLKARDEISQMNRKLQQSAVTDLLTGLLNRQGFAKKVDDYTELVRKGKRKDVCFTLLYIDLDNFKFCNDTFGHDVGDEILIAFSRLFERVTKNNGYIVRYGGDEFLIVMPDHAIDDGIELAKSIYKAIDKSNHFIPEIQSAVGEKVSVPEDHRVSCSIGIAYEEIYDQERMNIALKHADMKLYAVKKNQKSNYSVWRNGG